MNVCECHLIDWTKGPGKYTYLSTNKPYLQEGNQESFEGPYDCQYKVAKGYMKTEKDTNCQYISRRHWVTYPAQERKTNEVGIEEEIEDEINEQVTPISEKTFKE